MSMTRRSLFDRVAAIPFIAQSLAAIVKQSKPEPAGFTVGVERHYDVRTNQFTTRIDIAWKSTTKAHYPCRIAG